jgi:hypothetical protein
VLDSSKHCAVESARPRKPPRGWNEEEKDMDTPHEGHPENGAAGHRLAINVDGQVYPVSDPVLSGRQVLEAAEKHPVDDFIVYWVGKENVLQDLGLGGTVHLHHDGVERFLTFESDRSYRFELEGKREDWGASVITEETLLKLSGVGRGYRIWLERRDEPDRLIERGEVVDLTSTGIERFYSERVISVTVVNEDNGTEVQIEGLKHTKLDSLIEEMYKRLHVSRREDDRLRCEEGGGDVFGFSQLTLGHYVEAGHCRCLVWLFAGGTGGAS